MRLCEHPDFGQAIGRTEEHFRGRGLRAAIIEKDYYVTEVLRVVARVGRNRVIFKGGTSLSKGWNLISRFSEDIDLFLDPLAFEPPLGTKAIKISRAHFSRDYFPPDGMSFARSDALFPPASLATSIAREYDRQCQTLCYGPFPSWPEVAGRFEELREVL